MNDFIHKRKSKKHFVLTFSFETRINIQHTHFRFNPLPSNGAPLSDLSANGCYFEHKSEFASTKQPLVDVAHNKARFQLKFADFDKYPTN